MVVPTPERVAYAWHDDVTAPSLLGEQDGLPYDVVNEQGEAAILVVCEHASNRIPKALGDLGLDAEARQSHIAWDPGTEPVARVLAKRLDAPLVLQRFSRLVYDCNRSPEAASAMPSRSETFDVPGNKTLSTRERQVRTEAIYVPFHQAIERLLDRQIADGLRPALVTIHSFAPVFHGRRREVELGLLHDADPSLARLMHDAGRDFEDLDVRLNEPYSASDGVTHTLQRHALSRDLPNVMIEIRNDLIQDPKGQAAFADRLASMIDRAVAASHASTDRPQRRVS